MLKHSITLSILLLAFAFSGCRKDDLPASNLDIDPGKELQITGYQLPGAETVVIDETRRTIAATFPCGTDLTNLMPTITASSGNTVSPASGMAVNLSVPVQYTLVNGNLFSTWTVTASVRCITGFLSAAPSRGEITDDDEKAAADWFFANYDPALAKFVSMHDIRNGTVDLTQYKVLWWHYDRNDAFEMPAISQDPAVLDAIKAWYQAGGNLYLSGYANQYLWDLGRLSDNFPRAVGSGPGFENGDTWAINTNIGKKHDQSSHAIFAGIAMTSPDGRREFPVLGPGWREDHNFVLVELAKFMIEQKGVPLDPAAGINGTEAVYAAFRDEYDAEWLGTWGGINDYFMAGIIEFKPNDTFQGTAIFQGIGGIEYNQNSEGTINPDGLNQYQSNIDKLTKNTISYLQTK
jgi:hypothetical protein